MEQNIQRLRQTRKDYIRRQEIPLRDKLYREMAALHAEESVEKQFAYGFEKFLQEKSILIQKDDLLAGFAFHYSYNSTYPANGPEDFDPTIKNMFHMDVDREIREVKERIDIEQEKALSEKLQIFKNGIESWLYKHWHSGHVAAGYDRLIEKGFGQILQQEEDMIQVHPEKKDTLEAFQIVTRACIQYILRYQALAKKIAKESRQEEQKCRMERIAESCGRIAKGVPETFFDGVQLTWLAHELVLAENYPASVSIGRFDYFLYPLYEKDRKENRITRQEALELIEAFWIKCSANIKSYQNLTIGGTDSFGKSSVNDLTYLCMEATKRMKFDQPSLTFRWTDDLSEDVWPAIVDLMKTGMGFPAIFYDPCCQKAKEKMGIFKQDLYRYAPVGCVEITIPGKEYCLTEIGRLNLPKILELMFHQGRDGKNGKMFPLKNPKSYKEMDAIKDFEEFLKWYLSEMKHFLEIGVECVNACDRMYGQRYPLPLLSTMMEGCIEKGVDVSSGGACYNNSAFNMGGIATITDSLAAIQKLVYEEKRLKISDFIMVLDANYEGYEEIRQMAWHKCPKFGNDNDDVDQIGVKVAEVFAETLEQYRCPRGGGFRTGMYTVEDHAIMGNVTGATPDGRLKGDAFSNSMSSVQGKDMLGPTALINSVNKFDFTRATNGMVLDLKFTPTFLEKSKHINDLKALIETYFFRGGMEVQVSVVSRETLVEAQRNPKEYQDLIVRVSGFSAYFTTLRKVTQDEIIRRTEVS